jgi:hypothetical protein
MLKKLALVVCLYPAICVAQNAPGALPQDNVVKDTARQTDIVDLGKTVLHVKPKPVEEEADRTVYYSFLPLSTIVPGGDGHALVTSTTAGAYLGSPSTTNLSSASFGPYLNFKGRFGIPLRSSIWLPDNTWNIQGDMRFLVYPQYTWGIGTSHDYNQRAVLDYSYIRFYQAALKQVTPFFYLGLGYALDYHINVKSDDPRLNLHQFTGYNFGLNSNSFSSGITLNLLYDSRNNSLNPLPGCYSNIVYRVNERGLGSDETWRSLYVDFRKYIGLNPSKPNQQNTLALWSYLWTVFGNNPPYLDLPAINWDPYNRSGRGIDQGRYRGKTLFYFESEYRRDISHDGLFGFVIFGNVNTVSGSGNLFTSWHPAAGTGLRIKFNKGSNTNLGVDWGFSKGYNTFIINLGEAF